MWSVDDMKNTKSSDWEGTIRSPPNRADDLNSQFQKRDFCGLCITDTEFWTSGKNVRVTSSLQLNSLKILKRKNPFFAGYHTAGCRGILWRDFTREFDASVICVCDSRYARAQPSWFRTSDEFIIRWNKCNTGFGFSTAENKCRRPPCAIWFPVRWRLECTRSSFP